MFLTCQVIGGGNVDGGDVGGADITGGSDGEGLVVRARGTRPPVLILAHFFFA